MKNQAERGLFNDNNNDNKKIVIVFRSRVEREVKSNNLAVCSLPAESYKLTNGKS